CPGGRPGLPLPSNTRGGRRWVPGHHPARASVLGRGRADLHEPTGARSLAMIRYARRYLDEREKHRRWVDPRRPAGRAGLLQADPENRGWQPMPADRPGVLVVQEPTVSADGPFYHVVPLEEDWEGVPAQV